jgi:hypothetical protein
MERYSCARAMEQRAAAAPKSQRPPMISSEHATFCAEMICEIPFTRSTGGVLSSVAAELRALCETPEQATRLTLRMTRRVWPGVAEVRWVFRQAKQRLDGIGAIGESTVYPDGLPVERIAAIAASLAAPPPPKRLSAAGRSAAEPGQETITDLVAATKLSRILGPAPSSGRL